MRPLSPFLVLAAGLILSAAAPDAVAGPRGHGFAHGGPGRAAVVGHHPGFRHAWRHRHHRHHGFHHRFRHLPRFGGFWPGYVEPGYAAPAPVYLQPDFAALAYPTVLDLPELTGIRSAPAAAPMIYVLGGSGRGARPLGRKGRLDRTGAGVATVDGPAGFADPWETGPRIVELRTRRVP